VRDEVDFRKLAYFRTKILHEVLQLSSRVRHTVIRVVLEALHARVAEGDAE
jgi:hypothetical protein